MTLRLILALLLVAGLSTAPHPHGASATVSPILFDQTESNAQAPETTAADTTDDHPGEVELSYRMLKGMNSYLDRYHQRVVTNRNENWDRNTSSLSAYNQSVERNRKRLREIIGAVEQRPSVQMQRFSSNEADQLPLTTAAFTIERIRWQVLPDFWAEGLLLTPRSSIEAHVIAVPDAGQTPEQIAGIAKGIPQSEQFARRLAENGIQVLIPALVNRNSTFSGGFEIADRLPYFNPKPRTRTTNLPHREWIYRQAFEMGRHIIGYEVQALEAGIDWFRRNASDTPSIGLAGYGEGGLLALYTAALDQRVDAALVSGYFGPRDELWREPVYRNVWSLLRQFGDAEIASLVAPRDLVIEYSAIPDVDGPPEPNPGESAAAAPGSLWTPSLEAVQAEINRLERFFPSEGAVQPNIQFIHGDGASPTIGAGSRPALRGFADRLGVTNFSDRPTNPPVIDTATQDSLRQRRLVFGLTDHIQDLVRESDRERYAFVQGDRSSPDAWNQSMEKYRDYFWNDIIGKLPDPTRAPDARMWKIYDREEWTGYEVVIPVYGDVFAFGILCVPNDITPGEKRPVVVTQHGAGSLPRHTIRPDPNGKGEIYNSFADSLASRGFITFSPHNPSGNRKGFQFRILERKANPLQASIFSLITAQHQQILRWLRSLEYVDADRIGFYGLSWGGRTAIRVPAILDDGYALSITSGDFNDWVRKVLTVHYANSYMFSGAFETYEFNLGHTFNHAELAGLIAPRPFMVESGYRDGVADDSWVGYEYAKVHRLYDLLGIPERTEIEFFNGDHEINGEGTFRFLHRHLDWPRP